MKVKSQNITSPRRCDYYAKQILRHTHTQNLQAPSSTRLKYDSTLLNPGLQHSISINLHQLCFYHFNIFICWRWNCIKWMIKFKYKLSALQAFHIVKLVKLWRQVHLIDDSNVCHVSDRILAPGQCRELHLEMVWTVEQPEQDWRVPVSWERWIFIKTFDFI